MNKTDSRDFRVYSGIRRDNKRTESVSTSEASSQSLAIDVARCSLQTRKNLYTSIARRRQLRHMKDSILINLEPGSKPHCPKRSQGLKSESAVDFISISESQSY